MKMITHHASVRMQQRGIKLQTLECLIKYGSKIYDNRGCIIVYFNKNAIKRLEKADSINIYQTDNFQVNAYAVVSTIGEVITVGHLTKRLIRH